MNLTDPTGHFVEAAAAAGVVITSGAVATAIGAVVVVGGAAVCAVSSDCREWVGDKLSDIGDAVSDFWNAPTDGTGCLAFATCDQSYVWEVQGVDIGKDITRLPNDEIIPPGKRGNAPTSVKDGLPVEIHHNGQSATGPFIEMHPSDHRYGENYAKNHTNTGQQPSSIDRKEWDKARKQYWEGEWDSGRFAPRPTAD